MDRKLLAETLSACCEVDVFPLSLCSPNEVQALRQCMPGCQSVIVLAHHVQSPVEWIWFPLESERNHVTCPADLHIQTQFAKVMAALETQGSRCVPVPYPGRCGIRFKGLAHKTGLGKMGDNFLFLHREWGPWTHLRVILTDAVLTGGLPPCEEVCTHCGVCKTACPISAIREDTLLGEECDAYQDMEDAQTNLLGSVVYKCEICVRACPIGTPPRKVTLSGADPINTRKEDT